MSLIRKLLTIPAVLICLLAVGYFGLRIFLSSDYVSNVVRARLRSDLNCDVSVGRASLNLLGTLSIQNLAMSYRKADGMHEILKADAVDLDFEPWSLLDSRLRFTAIRLTGAALSFERDSEGWITLGRIVRPMRDRPPLSLTLEARNSFIRCEDVTIPVDRVRAQVSRNKGRAEMSVTESAILGGGLEGGGYVTLEEDPVIHGQFKFHHISLPRLVGEIKDSAFDVKGEASCEIALHGNASSPNLLTPGSRLLIEDFSLAVAEDSGGKERGPIVMIGRLDLHTTSAPVGGGALGKPMGIAVDLVEPEVSLPELSAARHLPSLIPTAQRLTAVAKDFDQVEIALSGMGLKVRHPRLAIQTGGFEGQVVRAGDTVTLRSFKAQLWGGSVEATGSFYTSEANWICEGRVDARALGLQNVKGGAAASAEMGVPAQSTPGVKAPDPSSLAGWLTGDMTFRANSKAETTFTGSGSAAVRRAKLWGLPCFSCVAELLKLPAEATELPQEFRCTFTAENDKVTFSRIELTNERIKVFGKGLAYYTGNSDLDLGVAYWEGKKAADPFTAGLRGILGEGTANQRYRVSVTGDIASPEAALATKGP